jgi:hypothetical protein
MRVTLLTIFTTFYGILFQPFQRYNSSLTKHLAYTLYIWYNFTMSADRKTSRPTAPQPASTLDITPLNHIDDPFLSLADDELLANSAKLSEALLVRLLVEDLERGLYSIGRIREKYLGTETYKPYPWLTPTKLAELLAVATDRMVNDNPIDVRFEISGYLASNLGLQATLFEMLDNTTSDRIKVEITRTINTLKKERLEFLRSIGHELAEQAADPSKVSMLPPGVLPVTDLLAQGESVNASTDTPNEYKGILTSGDIAGDERRGRSSTTELEDEQDTIHPASLLS